MSIEGKNARGRQGGLYRLRDVKWLAVSGLAEQRMITLKQNGDTLAPHLSLGVAHAVGELRLVVVQKNLSPFV